MMRQAPGSLSPGAARLICPGWSLPTLSRHWLHLKCSRRCWQVLTRDSRPGAHVKLLLLLPLAWCISHTVLQLSPALAAGTTALPTGSTPMREMSWEDVEGALPALAASAPRRALALPLPRTTRAAL